MKKNFKYVMLMATALILGFTSCSNDDVTGGENPVEEGKSTYATIKFTAPKTYGTPQVGTAAESTVNTIDVFIYDTNGFLKDSKQFTGATENPAGSGVWEAGTMPTTTGAKKVYIIVNLPSAIAASDLNTVGKLTSIAHAVTVADIATDNAFVMASDVSDATFDGWDGTGTAPTANEVKVTVKRLAAKLAVQETTGLTLAGIDGGDFSNLGFSAGQINTVTYAAQKIVGGVGGVGGVVQDPNHVNPTTPGDGLTDLKPTLASHIALNLHTVTDAKDLVGKYVPENTTKDPISGDLTYVSVKAEFLPEKVWNNAGGSWAEVPNAAPIGTFFCVKTTAGNIYFNTSALADAYCIAEGIDPANILEYTDGVCYYTVYPNLQGAYQVLRNDFFQIKVDKINGLGDTAPGPKDPTDPVGVQTNIDVTIEVAPWNLEVENVELTPQ